MYEPPVLEEFLLNSALNLLDSLSIEGDINDWEQQPPINLVEVE